MRVSACKFCGESINAGERGPLPEKCGPCMGRRRPGGPPLPRKPRPRKAPEERIRADRFTFVKGRVRSECGHCGRELWLPPRYHAAYRRHFCGAECRSAGSRNAVPYRFRCVRCGKQCSMQGNPRQKQKGLFCSRQCAATARSERAEARLRARAKWQQLSRWFHCWGTEESSRAVTIERTLFPSSRRLHRITLLRISRKRTSGKLRSRCKRFGVEYDSAVNRLSVCMRDNWICAICGVETTREVNRNNPSPREGTLDHIVPLSRRTKGNTWDNVQCACRGCNCYRKRDRTIGCQMRLF